MIRVIWGLEPAFLALMAVSTGVSFYKGNILFAWILIGSIVGLVALRFGVLHWYIHKTERRILQSRPEMNGSLVEYRDANRDDWTYTFRLGTKETPVSYSVAERLRDLLTETEGGEVSGAA